MRSLDGRVVVVTGAASGIGRAIAVRAAGQRAVLALSDVDDAGLEETARRCSAHGRKVRTYHLDVRDGPAVREHAAAVLADLGGAELLVNNAGVALHGDFAEVREEDFAWVVDVDFWGVVHGTRAFLPQLVASGDGHLVNMSSLFGLLAAPGQTAYNAAKFAVRGFSESLRQELLRDRVPVGVTCVHPGGVATAIARNARTSASHDHAEFADYFDRRLARTSPERAAERVLDGVLAGRPRVVVGLDAHLGDWLVRLSGAGYQRLLAAGARRQRF